MTDRNGLDPTELGLARGLGSAEDPLESGPASSLGDRESPSHGTNAAVHGELPPRRMLREPLRWNLSRRGEHGQRDRKVEAGALLPQPGGSEVYGDPLERPFELRRSDPAADAVLGLGAGPVGETDDGEPGDAAVDVRLHLDPARF